jgi:hypothetical protein
MTEGEMTVIETSNYLADLAARINAEHEAARRLVKQGAERAMNAGDLLIEAKDRVPHGQWLPWLAEHCEISERTAQLYMRLARARPEIEAKSATVADLSLRGAIAEIAPDPLEAQLKRIEAADVQLALEVEAYMQGLRRIALEFGAMNYEQREAYLATLAPEEARSFRRLWRRWRKIDDAAIKECQWQTHAMVSYLC